MGEGPYIGKQAAQKITGGAYGEGKDLTDIQTAPGVNMAASEISAADAMAGVTQMRPMPTMSLNSPNPNKDMYITDGASFGPGRDSSALPMAPQAFDETAQLIMSLAELYPDPDITRLAQRIRAEGRA